MIRKKLTQIGINSFWNLKYPKFTKPQKNCMKFIKSYGFNSELIKKQEEILINTNKFNLKYGIKVKY